MSQRCSKSTVMGLGMGQTTRPMALPLMPLGKPTELGGCYRHYIIHILCWCTHLRSSGNTNMLT